MGDWEEVTIVTESRQSCHIDLPVGSVRRNGLYNTANPLSLCEISWDAQKAVCCWSGLPSESVRKSTSSGRTETARLDPIFAKSIGLLADQRARVRILHTGLQEESIPMCKEVHIKPVSTRSWEIIERNPLFAEQTVYNQIRVMWPGMIFPLWIHQAVVHFEVTKIVASDTGSDLDSRTLNWYALNRDAEVIVAPKMQKNESKSSSNKDPNVLPDGINFKFKAKLLPSTHGDSAAVPKTRPTVTDCGIILMDYTKNKALKDIPLICTPPVWMHYTCMENTKETKKGKKQEVKNVVARLMHKPEVPTGHVVVHTHVQWLLGCPALGLVELRPVTKRPAQPGALSLVPFVDKRQWKSKSSAALSKFVNKWVKSLELKKRIYSVDRGLITIPIPSSLLGNESDATEQCTFQVVFPEVKKKEKGEAKEERDDDEIPFCVLHSDCGLQAEVDVKSDVVLGMPTDSRVTWRMPFQPKHKLIGIQEEKSSAWAYLSHVTQDDGPNNFPPGMIICGPAGVGKSELIETLAAEAEFDLLLSYVKLDCLPLQTKRVETIRRLVRAAVTQAEERHPSLLFLEKLDVLLPANGTEESESGARSDEISEFLKDCLEFSCARKKKIVLVATAKNLDALNRTITETWMFEHEIQLKPPEKKQRMTLIKHHINERGLSQNVQDIDFSKIMDDKTEGFVSRDLEQIVVRALHECSLRSYVNSLQTMEGGNGLQLVQEDFEKALEGYTAATLQNVTLHESSVSFADIGGMEKVKEHLLDTFLLPSKHPELFAASPLRRRSGILLFGPPGCGKTLIAGAVAKECGIRFITIAGPELLSKYIGQSEEAVRDVFARARAASPSILFFDEFDSIAPRRGQDGTGVTDRVVNQFLTQLDGVEGLEGVYVLAATSRPELIDPALLRPGRLDKMILCDMPNTKQRENILRTLLQSCDVDSSVSLEKVANSCEGFSGADLKGLVSDAQLRAVHDIIDNKEDAVRKNTPKKPLLLREHFEMALQGMRPSVSSQDLAEYNAIYRKYKAGAQMTDMSKARATMY
eukprot:m.75750 g.75750  ORF g.75750 m.75750 type:complete len:1035 (-) comp12521_c0_seq1:722-3826(-)